MLPVFVLLGQLASVAAAPPPDAVIIQGRAEPFTLAAAVAQARTASPRLRGAAAIAESLRDAPRVAAPWLNPSVELSTENWAPGHQPRPDLDVFALVTQPIAIGGTRAVRRQLAAADRDVAQAALNALERQVALDAAGAYLRALRARALVQTLAVYRDGLAELVASVARRVEEGFTAEADLLKFRTEAARVGGDLVRARLELERGLTALAIVVGAPGPIQDAQLVDPPPLAVPATEAGAIAAAVARHPDVIAAAAAVERARQAASLERARRRPEPAITGGYKRTAGIDTGVLGVTMTVPLFDRNDAAIARALGVERGAAADREALVQRLTAEAAAVVHAARLMAAQAAAAQADLLQPAEDVRRAARSAFREGAADALRLIDAERVYADVRRAAIDLRIDALLAAIEARFAVGEETIP